MYNVKWHGFSRHGSSIKHLRYFTLGSCLICISPYFMWCFLIFFFLSLEVKRIDFVLSSPKWILSLLSTNQSHILEKSKFNYFSISLISLRWQTKHESLACRKRWHLTDCDMSFAYIKNESGPKIEPWHTPQDTDAGWANLFSKLIRKDLLERKDLNQLTVCL